jgi:hypothetical protein
MGLFNRTRSLSKRERWACISILIVGCVAISVYFGPASHPDTVTRSYTELSDNKATITTEITARNNGALPMTCINDSTSLPVTSPSATWTDPASPAAAIPPVSTLRFLDDRGNALPFTVTARPRDVGPYKYQYYFNVPLPGTVWPGEKWTSRCVAEESENPLFLFREGDVWNYRIGCTEGWRLSKYKSVVKLPPDAHLVSVEPKPKRQHTLCTEQDGKTVQITMIEFDEFRRGGRQFDATIKYRLAGPEKADKKR